ncbi:PX-domain-containing protein [Exidia glandulosa HHB12029]|uniref:PX-domain-containing protein n=1 Tax=Exidia glandulosa HHB12029 TaxID=1314781 RepID=A0A165KIF8_EXIGL|nr:PX-domain-containing protein [Exidia glandulosa HHB12029]
MATFEDDANPFRTDIDGEINEPAPSSIVVDHDEHQPFREPSPTTPTQDLPPLPAKAASFPRAPPNHAAHFKERTEFCCSKDRYLHLEDDAEILIVDAQKTAEGSSSPYIVYLIRTGTTLARRRYSEFESLRNTMVKLYPTFIVPPIPSKQSLTDYAVKQSKAKEDATMIARRKRMLQTFLNRIAHHPVLSTDHTFHRFLDGDVSWSEVLHSPPVSTIPKDILRAPPHHPGEEDPPAGYQALPHPSPAQTLRNPDQRFLDSEAFTNKFASHLSGPLEKVTRRTMKRWSEYGHDHTELGGVLNGFSLSESGALAATIEKTGQAVDSTYLSTTQLLQEFEQRWAEPLHEYSQFGSIIRKLLAFRHQKHVQYEMTVDALESKKEVLDEFERSEAEARRLQEALTRPSRLNGSVFGGAAGADEDGTGDAGAAAQRQPELVAPPRRRATAGGSGLLGALSYSLQTMMDVDPETARRNNISKTRESIGQLEDALQLSMQDLKYCSQTIQADLDRFQRQKVADLREMAIAMARMHRDWCKQNLEAWEEVKKEVANVEPHPNLPPVSEEAGPSTAPSMGRAGSSGLPH